MKKLILIIVCIICTCGVSAQDRRFSWGVKAGLNLSTDYGQNYAESSIKAGYQVGLVGEYRASKLLAISPELVFSNQGARYKINLDGGPISSEIVIAHANYINLPIMLKLYVIEKLSIDFGPQFGYCVNMNSSGHTADPKTYNAFDFGLGLGATYNFYKFFTTARLNVGLTETDSGDGKNLNLQISAGYKF